MNGEMIRMKHTVFSGRLTPTRVFVRKSLMGVIFLSLQGQINASEIDFYSECNGFYAVADQFASECLQRARPFERDFIPDGLKKAEKDSFKIYFKERDKLSNFILGCTLNFKGKLDYLGIYYSHTKKNTLNFNFHKVKFIDYTGNVGLDIDGKQLTLLAIRQFKTDSIPQKILGYPTNCQHDEIESADHNITDGDKRLIYQLDINHIKEFTSKFSHIIPVKRFSANNKANIIFVDTLSTIFIDEFGGLIVSDDHNRIRNTCINQKIDKPNDANFLFEICNKSLD